jgi:excisionase family DNA binding protein
MPKATVRPTARRRNRQQLRRAGTVTITDPCAPATVTPATLDAPPISRCTPASLEPDQGSSHPHTHTSQPTAKTAPEQVSVGAILVALFVLGLLYDCSEIVGDDDPDTQTMTAEIRTPVMPHLRGMESLYALGPLQDFRPGVTWTTGCRCLRVGRTGTHMTQTMSTNQTLPRVMTTQQVADYLQIPVATIYAWRTTNNGPHAYKVGKHLRFRLSDVDAWLDRQVS